MKKLRLGVTIRAPQVELLPAAAFINEEGMSFADDIGLFGVALSPEEFFIILEEAVERRFITIEQLEEFVADYHSRHSH